MPIGFAVDQFVSGGLLNNVRATVESAAFTMDGPANYNVPGVVFLKLELAHMENNTKSVDVQYWAMGGANKIVPTADGRFVEVLPDAGEFKLVDSSNFAHLCLSLDKAGAAKHLMASGDSQVFVGLDAHWERVKVQREIRDNATGGPGGTPKREPEVLVVKKIYSGMGVRSAGGGIPRTTAPAAAGTPAPAPAGAAVDTDTLQAEAAKVLAHEKLGLVDGTPMEIKVFRTKVAGVLMALKIDAKIRGPITDFMVNNPEFMESQGIILDTAAGTVLKP